MQWIYKQTDDEWVLEHSTRLRLPYLHSRILLNRNLKTAEDIQQFFNPASVVPPDPFLLKDLDQALERIDLAVARDEKILVYGDYDVDGITAASTLFLFFRKFTPWVDYYIPDRESEGYGLSRQGIEYARDNGYSVILTCDCGISAVDEVDYARTLNIDVIITDHHKPAEKIPAALAVVNPKREDDTYPSKELCGAGVAYKLIQGYCMTHSLDKTLAEEYLDLVAMGTAADIVPIIGENRWIMSKGLTLINRSPRLGLRELIHVSKLQNKEITVTEIVFVLAPRMNAVGRLGEASRAIKLLTTDDQATAREFADILNEENLRRRDIEKTVMDEALIHISHKYGNNIPPILVLADDQWHSGVIGIVSSKLKERFHRPVIMISVTDGKGKGSARSITGFDMYEALSQNRQELETFGGHTMAAGLTIDEDNIHEFEQSIVEYAEDLLNDEMLAPKIYLEADIHIEELNLQLMELMDGLHPFGPGNMRPKFSISNIQPLNPKILSGGHLKFKIKQDNYTLDCIGWNMADQFELVMSPDLRIDVAFVPQINHWNGNDTIQLVVKDIRKHNMGA